MSEENLRKQIGTLLNYDKPVAPTVGSVVEQEFGERVDALIEAAQSFQTAVAQDCGDGAVDFYENELTEKKAALTAKYEQVVRERNEARDAFRGIEIEAGMPEGGDILEHIHGLRSEVEKLREDALNEWEADAALRELPLSIEIPPRDIPKYDALKIKLRRIASRTSTDGAGKTSGCNCGGSDEAGHKGTCPEVF